MFNTIGGTQKMSLLRNILLSSALALGGSSIAYAGHPGNGDPLESLRTGVMGEHDTRRPSRKPTKPTSRPASRPAGELTAPELKENRDQACENFYSSARQFNNNWGGSKAGDIDESIEDLIDDSDLSHAVTSAGVLEIIKSNLSTTYKQGRVELHRELSSEPRSKLGETALDIFNASYSKLVDLAGQCDDACSSYESAAARATVARDTQAPGPRLSLRPDASGLEPGTRTRTGTGARDETELTREPSLEPAEDQVEVPNYGRSKRADSFLNIEPYAAAHLLDANTETEWGIGVGAAICADGDGGLLYSTRGGSPFAICGRIGVSGGQPGVFLTEEGGVPSDPREVGPNRTETVTYSRATVEAESHNAQAAFEFRTSLYNTSLFAADLGARVGFAFGGRSVAVGERNETVLTNTKTGEEKHLRPVEGNLPEENGAAIGYTVQGLLAFDMADVVMLSVAVGANFKPDLSGAKGLYGTVSVGYSGLDF